VARNRPRDRGERREEYQGMMQISMVNPGWELKLNHSSWLSNRAFGKKVIIQFLIELEKVMNREIQRIAETTKEIANYEIEKIHQIAYRSKHWIRWSEIP
jgi:hypothetical protein